MNNNQSPTVRIPDPNCDFNLQSNSKQTNKPHHRRTNSTSSQLSTIDLNDSTNDNWNFFTSTQNLASVLNNPNVNRNVADQIFIKDWGSYFSDQMPTTQTNLKQFKLKREYVDSFIQNLNQRDKFKKNLDEHHTINGDHLNGEKSIDLENLIPPIFLKENFQLENLDTFKDIFEGSLKTDNESIKQTIKDLEKSLTDHLDVVEEHLAKQISVRFREFFHIMNAMELVMEQLNTTIKEVTLVRKNCNRLQENLVYPSLKNIQLTKRKATLQSVYEKIRIMATVHETQPTIQNFLSTSDYVGALDLITATQEVYDQDLNGLNSFRHLNSQLSEIKNLIIQMMKEAFVKFLTQEWNRPFTKSEIELKSCDHFDKEKLSCMIIGMLRVDYYEFIDTFKEEAYTTIETWIKQTVIELLHSEDIVFKSSLPFDQLNELEFYKWLNVVTQIFRNLYIVLKRIQIIHLVIGEVIKQNNSSKLINNKKVEVEEDNEDDEKLSKELHECLFKICQFSHTKCSDIINSKTRNNYFISNVSFDEFSDLVKLIERFTACCEEICPKSISQLKLALRTQTNKYVTKFHDDHRKSIISLLEIEQWKPFEQINPEFQQIINDLIDYNYSFSEIHKSRKQAATQLTTASKLKCLEVNGEKFVIVYTIISFVYIVIEYCSIAADIKSIAPDLLTRLVNLFKQFNSKIMKLVLLAEAVQISGLKTITSRHLIVANRCLKLVLILLPYVKNHFTSILLERHRAMLKHFDEVKELYVKHIQETIKKVIEVVNDVLVAKINKWEAKPPVPSTEFKEITIHLQRLYSNIQETLPEDELNQLLFQIYESFNCLLKEQILKLKITNDGGPQHFLVKQELAFFKESLPFFNDEKYTFDIIWSSSS